MSSLLRLMVAVVLVVLTAGPHVRAQTDSGSVYATARPGTNTRSPFDWLLGRSPRQNAAAVRAAQPKSYQPRRRGTPPPKVQSVPGETAAPVIADGARPATGDPVQPPAESMPGAAVPPPAPVQPPVTVAVVGDSLSVFLAQGLADLYAERPSISFVKRNKESSGLVREDYYDWPKAMADVVAATPKPDAVLIMIGSNDRQQLRDDKGVYEPLTEPWRALYAQRIDAMIKLAREAGVPLIWVGLPTMRSARYSADLLVLNEAYRSRSQNAGTTFVDIWEAFANEDSNYSATGPDVDGELVRLRTSDGVHFTKAGARKLAFFADRELQKIVASIEQRAIVPVPMLRTSPGGIASAPVPSLMPPQAITLPLVPATIDEMLGVALPDTPLLSTLAPRPLEGAVVALTAPPVSAGGVLAGPLRNGSRPAPVSGQGYTGNSKPGRADDFRVDP